MLSLTVSPKSEQRLVDQIVAGIKRQIQDRHLRPGAKLPSIRNFAETHSVRGSQRLRLRFGAQSLCLPRPQRAEEIPPRFRQATRRADERRDYDLLCAQAGLRGLRAQAQVLSERSCAQNRALVHEAARDKVRAIAKTEATPSHVSRQTANETAPTKTSVTAQVASRLNQLRDTNFSPR
jgi:DNA-binding transcriptional MocR family regulator